MSESCFVIQYFCITTKTHPKGLEAPIARLAGLMTQDTPLES